MQGQEFGPFEDYEGREITTFVDEGEEYVGDVDPEDWDDDEECDCYDCRVFGDALDSLD